MVALRPFAIARTGRDGKVQILSPQRRFSDPHTAYSFIDMYDFNDLFVWDTIALEEWKP